MIEILSIFALSEIKKRMKVKGQTLTNASRGMAILLTILHLFIGVSYSFYIHVHTLDNGQRVVHSHPVSENDSRSEAQHHHDVSTLLLIPNLSSSISESPQTFTFETQLQIFKKHLENSSKPLSHAGSSFLRGPPAIVYFKLENHFPEI